MLIEMSASVVTISLGHALDNLMSALQNAITEFSNITHELVVIIVDDIHKALAESDDPLALTDLAAMLLDLSESGRAKVLFCSSDYSAAQKLKQCIYSFNLSPLINVS